MQVVAFEIHTCNPKFELLPLIRAVDRVLIPIEIHLNVVSEIYMFEIGEIL